MTISERMFKILDASKGKSASGLCKVLGINQSVTSGWKERNSDPPAKYLLQICEYLGVSLEYLLSGEYKQTLTCEGDEAWLIAKYRQLDEDGRVAVKGVLLQEQRRVQTERGEVVSEAS